MNALETADVHPLSQNLRGPVGVSRKALYNVIVIARNLQRVMHKPQ